MSIFWILYAVGFGGTALLVAWYVLLAAIGARQSEREAIELWDQGLCPCCGKPRRDSPDIQCPDCGNRIEGYRRAAEKRKKAAQK